MKKLLLLSIIAFPGMGWPQRAHLPDSTDVADTVMAADSDKEIVRRCKEWFDETDYSEHEVCTYSDANLNEVYDIIARKSEYFKPSLPGSDIEYEITDNEDRAYLTVTYRYIDDKHLTIEEYWIESCASTLIELIEKDGGVTANTTNFLP